MRPTWRAAGRLRRGRGRSGAARSKHDLLPIATAVSASAAFPILLTPVAFQDYSNGCQGKLRNGEWIGVDLSNPYTPYLNLAAYKDARYSNDLRHGPNPS